MPHRIATLAAVLLVPSIALGADGETKRVTGRVLDEAGRPAAGIEVAPVWGANGFRWEQVDALRAKGVENLWRAEGRMQPWGDRVATTAADGTFVIDIHPREFVLLAFDATRERGAQLRLDPRGANGPVEPRLGPTVAIRGTVRLADAKAPLGWSCAYLNLPDDEANPLAIRRIGICGSFKTRFEFRVPAGDYTLSGSSESPTAATVEPRPVSVAAGSPDLDLGPLTVALRLSRPERMEQAKARGTWGDFREHFGHEPPPWHLSDARGVGRDAKLSDFRGRWVLLYFWGPYCAPCLGKQLPELMAFHEARKAQRDRFEILAFCLDYGQTIKDMDALDRCLDPVVRNVWGGKRLPFPVLLDSTYQTWERYGLEGAGVSSYLLIDPSGKLVRGGLDELAKALGPVP